MFEEIPPIGECLAQHAVVGGHSFQRLPAIVGQTHVVHVYAIIDETHSWLFGQQFDLHQFVLAFDDFFGNIEAVFQYLFLEDDAQSTQKRCSLARISRISKSQGGSPMCSEIA